MTQNYTGDQIKVLEGLEAVRKRPGMYIGDTGVTGFHHCLWEIVDNSVDEHLAGHCNTIEVKLAEDGSISVEDDGRGIPVDVHPEKGIPTVTLVMTTLHAGGKFENESGQSAYKTSGGLHGVGASVVNALSEWMEVEVKRDGKHYRQRFERGNPVTGLEEIGSTTEHGTKVTFKPDPTIFVDHDEGKRIDWDEKKIADALAMRAYLNPGLEIKFIGEASEEERRWKAESFGEILNVIAPKEAKWLHDTLIMEGIEDTKEGPIEVSVAMRIQAGRGNALVSFANNIRTPQGGAHEQGFRTALLRTINKYGQEHNLIKESLTAEDVREGLFAAVSVRLINPRFAGQTKEKLANTAASGAVSKVVGAVLRTWFEENPKEAKAIIQRAVAAQKARLAAEKAREKIERKTAMGGVGTLPGKLADCQSRNPDETELFIVEGDSAGGSAKQGRDRAFQAILPLKGKPLNVWRSEPLKMLKNEEISAILTAIGAKMQANGKAEVEKFRYSKVIIMTDADVDGAHITTLLITLFYQVVPEIIREGRLFVAMPPLYRARKGSKYEWIRNDAELARFREINGDGWEVQRFKGLGEMNPDELWETTMNPDTRTLVKVEHDPIDQEEMDQLFELLMGGEVGPRRQFIEENAEYASIA